MERVEKITIDTEKCVGCKKCVKACATDVLRFDETTEKAVAAYPQECEWCLICEEQCPVNAIYVKPKIPAPIFEYGLSRKEARQ
jgi:NAD-dependent dihydropyrimidine dehydrogenase PreA subunit